MNANIKKNKMKLLKIITFSILFSLVLGCKQTQDEVVNKDSIDAFAQKMIKDENNQFMATIWPTDDQIEKIFKGKETVATMKEYCAMRKKQLPTMRTNLMSPSNPQTKTEIESISQKDIDAKNFGKFHKLNEKLINRLQKGVKMYGIHYIKPDGKTEKFRSGIFNVAGKWIFIPYPAQAFRPKKITFDPSKVKGKRK